MMGFMDKIKSAANQIKEENRNLGSTMKRMNNRADFFGNVNRGIKDGDFWQGSYLNIENGKGVIYGSSQDDYVFGFGDIKKCTVAGRGADIPVGNQKFPSMRLLLTFGDGKTAQADVFVQKVDLFKTSFGIT